MKLVIGGAYQQKREAAMELFGLCEADFADGALCGPEEIFSCRALFGFHEYVRRCMKQGYPAETLAERLAAENPDILIISDEIGCGVVPLSKEDREWRERTGRILCRIAQLSDAVVRVTAGIPTVIKGSV